MNPYAFRGWHLPSAYSDSANCDRNYTSVYSAPWTSSYLSPPSVYPFQPDDISGKPTSTGNWKLNGLTSTEASHVSMDTNMRKSGYESVFCNNSANRAEFESCIKDDTQRSCCAVSCTSSIHHTQNWTDSSCRSSHMSAPTIDFNISACLSSYQSLGHRDMQQSIHLPSSSLPATSATLKKRRRPYSKLQIAELEREYSGSTYISKSRRWELSQLISLSERQIKIWFQNRRIKAKKIHQREVTTPYSSPSGIVRLTNGPPLTHRMQAAIPVS